MINKVQAKVLAEGPSVILTLFSFMKIILFYKKHLYMVSRCWMEKEDQLLVGT